MTPAEKFNNAVDMIEELITDLDYNLQDIGLKVASESFTSLRDMSNIFRFMADITLHDYISSRKLNAAYSYLINPWYGNGSILEAVSISGYADQPSFSKAFKKKFGMTPRQAQKSGDDSRLEPPITWDMLSGNFPSKPIEPEEKTMSENIIFGIKEEELNRISKILSLEAFYGFTRMLSEYAYQLHESTNQSVDDCFRYVESLQEYKKELDEQEAKRRADSIWFDTDDEEYKGVSKEWLHEIGDNKVFQEIFFAKGISVSFITTLMEKYKATKDMLMKCDMIMLKAFPPFKYGTYMNFSYYIRAYEYWTEEFNIEETEESFDEFLDLFFSDYSLEEAFWETYSEAMWECGREHELYDDYDPYIDETIIKNIKDDYDPHFEEWAIEQESNWDGERIDDDLYYDPDNIDIEFYYD